MSPASLVLSVLDGREESEIIFIQGMSNLCLFLLLAMLYADTVDSGGRALLKFGVCQLVSR